MFRDDKRTLDDNLLDYFRYFTHLLFLKDNKQRTTAQFINSYEQYKEVYAHEDNLLKLSDNLNKFYNLVVVEQQTDTETLNNFINSLPCEMGLSKQQVQTANL